MKLKDLETKEEVEVRREEVVPLIKEKLSLRGEETLFALAAKNQQQ